MGPIERKADVTPIGLRHISSLFALIFLLGLTAFTPAAENALGGPLLALDQQGAAASPAQPSASNSGRGGGDRRQGPRPDWWNDPAVRKEIGLSAEKAKRIDDMYQTRWKELKPTSDALEREREKLTAMTRAATAEPGQYRVQLLTVETLRSDLNQSRSMLLYQIYRTLQPEQNRKLQEYFERRNAERQAAFERENAGTAGRGRQ